ncbi:MAG: hypothetical protein KBA74_08050 [Prevotella sp.]|nr:hypothetical protein [Prevotella sp.]
MTSCAVSKETVNYKEVKNYFYRNDAPKGEQLLKLTTQVEFDRYFGAAAFMGKNGQPTQIDFKKDFVIAKVLPETNRATEIKDIKLAKSSNGHLTFSYSTTDKEPQSFSIRPTVQITVSREYMNAKLESK